MIFQINRSSTWKILLQIYSVVIPALAALIAGIILSGSDSPETRTMGVILFVVGVIGIGCLIWLTSHIRVKADTSFSNQLMDEYHAKSSRSFSAIEEDLYRSYGTSTVFTRDGKDTSVFIRRINQDGKKTTMTFTVIDDNSFYPKPSK
jgi:hypothetical protein